MLRLKIFFCCLIFSQIIFGQNNSASVFTSPKGNYLFLKSANKNLSFDSHKEYAIYRSIKGENKFSITGSFSPVKNFAEFQNIVGEPLAVEFKNYIKAKTNEGVIKFFKEQHPLKAYGLFLLNIDFLRAIGIAYLDELPTTKALQYEYKITDASGSVLMQQAPLPFNKSSLPKGLVKKIHTTDSLVSIRWEFPNFKSAIPLLAKIYRQDDGKGNYFAYPQKVSVTKNDEGQAYVMLEEKMTPEHLVNYYIVPVDMLGNVGLPSDTATAITIDYKKLSGIQNITIKDTLDGLLANWKPLPAKPYYTGIQILRSRDARKDFIVLDSLAANATSYLDKKVLPNITYFYMFRPLVYKLSGWSEVIATSVHGSKGSSHNQPLPPNNLTVSNEGANIRLTWDPNMELDLFAYYVLRGTSSKNMEIVSPAIMDTTWLDSTANLSSRTNYVYSVLAMNNNQLKSEISNTAGIKPIRKQFVEAPAGISLHVEGKKIILTWTDTRRNDAAIVGYILYRKKISDKEFAPIKDSLITGTFYEDAEAEPNTSYQYTVTSVDFSGNQSNQSPYASAIVNERIQPPSKIYVRMLISGIEISWPRNIYPDILSYTVYRKLPDEKNYLKIGTAKSNDGSFIDKNFIPNKLNVYAITIITKNGESGKSVEKSIFGNK
jgi:fibronectin type 3 domain-containing protein